MSNSKLRVTPLKVAIFAFAILVLLLILSVSSMYLFPYSSVQVPSTCKNVSEIGANTTTYTYGNSIRTDFAIEQSRSTLQLKYIRPNYTIPRIGTGTLLTGSASVAVVVQVDYNNPQFNSTLYIVNRSNNVIIRRMQFGNDFLAATISNDTLYLYNSGLGYIINSTNGETVGRAFTIDNYRGIVISKNSTYVQTTAIIAGLGADGAIYQPNLTFSAIAFGCFIPKPT